MHNPDSVEVIEEWLLRDLSSSKFTDDEKRDILDLIDKIEEDLTVWDRDLTKIVSPLKNTGSVTVYRGRTGDLRCYFVRDQNTLYCIGAGKRKKTYDRDLKQIKERAEEQKK